MSVEIYSVHLSFRLITSVSSVYLFFSFAPPHSLLLEFLSCFAPLNYFVWTLKVFNFVVLHQPFFITVDSGANKSNIFLFIFRNASCKQKFEYNFLIYWLFLIYLLIPHMLRIFWIWSLEIFCNIYSMGSEQLPDNSNERRFSIS